MEQQAREALLARLNGRALGAGGVAHDELNRLLQLTQELFKSLRAAEELLPSAESLKAATSRYCARIDQITTTRYGSLPTNGDGAYEEREALDSARRRAEKP